MSIDDKRTEILQGLNKALQNMLSHAHDNNWQAVENYNTLRVQLSGQLQPTNKGQNPEEKRIINELCRMDAEILELAQKARNAAAENVKDNNCRRSNVNQYLQNQNR